jgi:hypothetical protein
MDEKSGARVTGVDDGKRHMPHVSRNSEHRLTRGQDNISLDNLPIPTNPPNPFISTPNSPGTSIQTPRSRPTSTITMEDGAKLKVIANYLYQHQNSNLWIQEERSTNEGVLLRKTRGQYITCPSTLAESALAKALGVLNPQVSEHRRH